MMNQIITWWVNNFSLQLGNNPRFEDMILSSIGVTGIAVYEWMIAKYLGFGEPSYTLINTPLAIIAMAFSFRIVSQIYIKIGNAIARRCDSLSTRLLNHHGLEPNNELNGPIPDYISTRKMMLSSFFTFFGGATGFFLIGAASYYSLRFMTLPEPINLMVCYPTAALLGGVPGCVFGFTAGRLIDHTPELISKRLEKRRLYQQARSIALLNDLPCNANHHRYFPPEILGIIHSFLIGTSEQESTRIINEVMNEDNNNICNKIHNKFRFFVSTHPLQRPLIKDIETIEDEEDKFEPTALSPMHHVKNS